MKAEVAIAALLTLKQQAVEDPKVQAPTPTHDEWKAKATTVLVRGLGRESATVEQFMELRYSIGVWAGSPGEAESDAHYFRGAVQQAVALIDAAIWELELETGSSLPLSNGYDEGLWDHVKHSVAEERWEQVASAAAIYVEDAVRKWAGSPRDKTGKNLVGHVLFTRALDPDGPLALGSQSNEAEGWRSIGAGMSAALGNVDRHTIQQRPDLKKYAIGVLGVASLLLTQIRYQHPEVEYAAE